MRILIVGGGAGGLLTGLLLHRDGHEVTILERDVEGPPADDEQAWDTWNRRGVSQMHQPHGFIGRVRMTLSEELPDVWDRILEADTYPMDLRRVAPDQDALIDSDARFQAEVMRRTTFDRAVGLVAEEAGGLEVLRGVAVTGLISKATRDGVPIVSGVTTQEHGDFTADLVIDSGGRRTAAKRWLSAIDAPVEEWSESDGFTYHSLWFRTHDGGWPEMGRFNFAGLAPGLVALLFPSDAGVFGIAMVGLGSDKPMRRLRNVEAFTSVAAALPLLSGWVDPEVAVPISEVLPMGAIQNRRLRFWNGNGPSVYGFVNIGDSVLSTNPSLGRGIPVALVGALELRSLLRESDDPQWIAEEFDRVKEERLLPYLWDAVESDRGLRRAFRAALGDVDGSPLSDRTLMVRASMRDQEAWRRWTAVNHVFDLPSSCFDDEELMGRVREIGSSAPPPEFSLSRTELELLLG